MFLLTPALATIAAVAFGPVLLRLLMPRVPAEARQQWRAWSSLSAAVFSPKSSEEVFFLLLVPPREAEQLACWPFVSCLGAQLPSRAQPRQRWLNVRGEVSFVA